MWKFQTLSYQTGSSCVLICDLPFSLVTVFGFEVPYGDHFSVEEKIELLREGDGVLVTKSWSADFVKRTFLRSVIESRVTGLDRKPEI